MATSQAKRSRSSAQSRAPKPAAPGHQSARRHRIAGALYLDDVRGKTLEDVCLNMDSDFNTVTLSFTDHTELTIDVQPGLAMQAMLESFKTGNSRVLKRWPRVRSG